MKVTIIGAGKTGRGFLARLLEEESEITFIDKNEELVKELNSSSFSITYFGHKWDDVTISGYKALTWNEVTSIDADLILVSVGGTNLVDVGSELAKYIKAGQRIIVCENASSPAKKLYDAIGIEGVKIAESTVFCTTIEADGLNISSECYPYLQYDSDALDDVDLGLFNIKGVNNFSNFLTRKLYTYNSAACIIAYLGFIKGYTNFGEAANDEEILSLLDKNYKEVNKAMCIKYGYKENDQKEFALLSRNKFTDQTIVDTIERNGREPQRKIVKGERIVGIMMLMDELGLDTSVLEKTLAASLYFDYPKEINWRALLLEKGFEGVLTDISGLDPNSSIYKRVLTMAKTKNIL